MPGYKWVKYTSGKSSVPGMISAGLDLDGSKLVIGRAKHEGDILPAKAKPEHGIAYVSYDGKEFLKRDFEILIPTKFNWVPSRNGILPQGAVETGKTSIGESLYAGRVKHDGIMVPGKIHPHQQCLYIPFDGKELRYKEYETLVQN